MQISVYGPQGRIYWDVASEAEFPPSWSVTVCIWWAFFWRYILLLSLIQALTIGLVLYSVSETREEAGIGVTGIGVMVALGGSVAISLMVMRRILGKKFKDFRLSITRFKTYTLSEESASLVRMLEKWVGQFLTALRKEEIDQLFVALTQIGKKDGILAFCGLLPRVVDDFLFKTILMVTDGIDPEAIRRDLETDIPPSLSPDHEIAYRKVIEGAVAIQEGADPSAVKKRLSSVS